MVGEASMYRTECLFVLWTQFGGELTKLIFLLLVLS